MYDEEGMQRCKHWDCNTPENLKWLRNRYEELEKIGKDLPLSVRPTWVDVEGLRKECIK